MTTLYAVYSTNQSYTETINGKSSCSSLNGEFFYEDAYGNPISVDVVSCHEMYPGHWLPAQTPSCHNVRRTARCRRFPHAR